MTATSIPATTEVCPHCKTALNPGATACTGCGAFETTGWDQLGVWKYSLLWACFLVGPFMAFIFLFFSPLMALIILAGSIGGYFYIRSRLRVKTTWAVGGRRVI